LTITRVYDPALWWAALAAHVIYVAGMAAAAVLIARHRPHALWTLAALAPGMIKAAARTHRAARALPEYSEWFRRWGWVHMATAPFVAWVWLGTLLTSASGNRIEWRGSQYQLTRPRWNERVAHKAPAPTRKNGSV
jgi:hypothetical protein